MEIHNYLPPEWHKQSAVMLTWPHEKTIWANTINDIDQVFVTVAQQISQREKVIISCFDDNHKKHISQLLANAHVNPNAINIYIAPCDDIWVRDHGPIAVQNSVDHYLLDFQFNGWGNKYPHANDNLISQRLHAQSAFNSSSLKTINLVLEGGALEVDGKGTLLTTSNCLLSETRNPSLNKTMITSQLEDLLGINRILWLDHGKLAGDDTDGHIDTLARFIDPYTIAYVTCDDKNDEHYNELKAMEAQLKTFTNYQNKPYQLVPLPWPQARFADEDGRRLPVTYANFLIINNAVLVPLYDDPQDARALNIFAKCFPQHDIIGINCLPVIQWYGSLHCMTMQLPQGIL